MANENDGLPLLEASGDTTVEITSVMTNHVELLLTVTTANDAAGEKVTAALQDVATKVRINFTKQTPLCWMASVLKVGSISPNYASHPFTQNADTFTLPVTDEITVSHDDSGWKTPIYDGTKHVVHVGFGVQVNGTANWAFAVAASPNSQGIVINAAGFELFRTNGSEQPGAPVNTNLAHWSMDLGKSYLLSFDDKGVGTLTPT